ncbi:BTAD domain-containing putative transcriptional regulator [Streptomyces sp. NPDC014892]|uniref:AfsR/SARP family transcriptional regulator n=1 Tax=Streptomyces sp. NPDC014892 TaxID=3364930 RepID=UPI0036FA020D
MEFRLLGTPEVWLDGRQLRLTAGKPMSLLVAGLLRAGRVVSAANLVDAVWGEDPPTTASGLLQTYVSNLRRALHVDGRQLIVTRAPGYLVDVAPEDIDLGRFEALAAEGRAAATAGEHARAAETLGAALAIWRGPALDGLDTPVLRRSADSLEEHRLTVLEERISAELRLNRIGRLAAELAELVAAHPLRETLRAHQMLVLYRLGRQADALEAFRQARQVLRSDLGVDPGPELRRMHQAILNADPALDPPRGTGTRGSLDGADRADRGAPGGWDEGRPDAGRNGTGADGGGVGTGVRPRDVSGDRVGGRPEDVSGVGGRPRDLSGVDVDGRSGHVGGLGAGDRAEDAGAAGGRADAGSRSVPSDGAPRQLPPRIGELVGRDEETAELRLALETARGADRAVACLVTGKAGSGKTALANVVAHAVRDDFPDGQLYAAFRGKGAGADTAETHDILGAFLRALGEPASRLPDTLEERSNLLRSRLTGRRVLMVLDNAATEAQVRPLLPAHGGGAALVTSRTALVGLESQCNLGLDVLEPDDATRLLARLVGGDRVAEEPAAAAEIVDLCGGLPLALRTVGARLAARQRWPLSVLAVRLRDEHRRLDELVAGDLEVRASLQLSYSRLPDPIRLVFRRLGVVGPAQFSPWLLASLLDVTDAKADYYAEQLADAQLVDPVGISPDGQVRYGMHNLIQLFARERARAEEPPDDQRHTVERLGRHLLTVIAALRPATRGATDSNGATPGRAATAPVLPSPTDDAHAWLDQEQWLLVQTVERAADLGLHTLARELTTALFDWFRLRNTFDAWWRTHDHALRAARSAGDRPGEATLLRGLGQLRYNQDRLDDAAEFYHAALEVFRDLDEPRGQADCLIGEASAHREQGRFPEALKLLEEADTICTRLDDAAGLAECAYGIGYIHREVGALTEAEDALRTALAAYRAAGDRRGEGKTLRSLAMVHRAGGALTEAEGLAHESVAVFRADDDRLFLAYGLQCLGKIRIRQHRYDEAADLLREALGVCTAFGDRFGAALVTRTIGELHLAAGRLDEALAHLTAARDQWSALRLDLFRARTDRDLADLHRRRGDTEAAETARTEALETFLRFGTREYTELTDPRGQAGPAQR